METELDSADEWLDELRTSYRELHMKSSVAQPSSSSISQMTAAKSCLPAPPTPGPVIADSSSSTSRRTAAKSCPQVPPTPTLAIAYRIGKFKQAGKVLQDCIAKINGIVDAAGRLLVYKVGATYDPAVRWQLYLENDPDRYTNMLVIAVLHSSEACAYLEAAVIREFLGQPGCRNIGFGGENVCTTAAVPGPYYVYLVSKALSRTPPA